MKAQPTLFDDFDAPTPAPARRTLTAADRKQLQADIAGLRRERSAWQQLRPPWQQPRWFAESWPTAMFESLFRTMGPEISDRDLTLTCRDRIRDLTEQIGRLAGRLEAAT